MVFVKIGIILILTTLVKAQQNSVDIPQDNRNSSQIRNDEYVEANRRIFLSINSKLHDQIKNIQKSYSETLEIIEIQKDYLLNEIQRVDDFLYPLSLLSYFSKNCTQKYKSLIPSASWSEIQLNNCLTGPRNQANYVVSALITNNRTLNDYLARTFEKDVLACTTKFNSSQIVNQTLCQFNVVTVTNAYVQNIQKTFNTLKDNAKHLARTQFKNAQECYFGVHNAILSKISEAKTRIDQCLRGLDDCSRCGGNYCKDIYNLAAASVNTKNRTMVNPFYGKNKIENCLMLNIV
ncbi:uncharacterized protein LOC142235271 [Haematobia irritans]|uniref:uncharacterized protein LOC142235271 n=1 Tax=Haematobia irritans TaxID=7368 RepID=UPI003F4F48A5